MKSSTNKTELALLKCLEDAWQRRDEVACILSCALLGVYESKTLSSAKRIALAGLRKRLGRKPRR